MGFITDLQFGNEYEKIFCDIMKFEEFNISTGNFKEYDIIDLKTGKKYEIKSDRLAYKTGNLCIEYMCNKKLSGISTTTADYYGYFIQKQDKTYHIYVIPTEKIKLMIDNKSYVKSMNGGDGWKSTFYLFKVELFEEFKL